MSLTQLDQFTTFEGMKPQSSYSALTLHRKCPHKVNYHYAKNSRWKTAALRLSSLGKYAATLQGLPPLRRARDYGVQRVGRLLGFRRACRGEAFSPAFVGSNRQRRGLRTWKCQMGHALGAKPEPQADASQTSTDTLQARTRLRSSYGQCRVPALFGV